jgi:hypothetical protein
MDDPVVISLVVSGIGMLVLFLALAFLYGLMYLMTAFIRDRPEPEIGKQGREKTGDGRQESGGGAQVPGGEKRRIAAIGVAMARAELEMSGVEAPAVEAASRGWRALHRRRQLTLNTTMEMRTRSRRGR